ncbi:MAG TPA: hypothetical protein VHK06_06165 [Candidatus Limnocylindria bacterium]|nr:hypothetical protein [Candidatus Limnocylindria bacterium]
MSIPSSLRRPLRPLLASVLLAGLLLPIVAIPASAAGPITMAARPLVAGRFEPGGWVAIAVSLANDAAPVDGILSTETDEAVVRRRVELPGGARKELVLYLRPDGFQRRVVIRFDAPGVQTVRTEVEIRAHETGAETTALVGDAGGAARAQLIARESGPEPLSMAVGDIPPRPEPLDGIETMVWAGDSGVLSPEQRRSVERWVAAGGQLVVIGGPDFQARTAGFARLLPVVDIAARDEVDLAPLAALASPDAVAPPPQTVAVGEPTEGAVALARGTDGGALVVSAPRGAGAVTYVAADLATEPFRAWSGAPGLWTRLIPQRADMPQFGGPPIAEEQANAMLNALANLPSLEVPPAELLLAVIVGYILLIGPISYLVLRRVDRRELAWVTAPVLVLLFTACSFGIGTQLKGGDVIVNEISLVRVASGVASASVQTFAGLYSPGRATYDLTVHGDALIAPLRTGSFGPVPAAEPPEQLVTEQGDPAHLRDVRVNVSSFRTLRAETVVDYTPNLEVAWQWREGRIAGTVTNTGDEPVDDVAAISNSDGDMIGELGPGEAREFTIAAQNFQGMPAGDRVYGFSGGPPDTDRARRAAVRREVINALVGYGGFPVAPGSAPGDRGPFIIGWRLVPGPTEVEVDGHEVERYSQTVEVVSGRPVLAPGEVTLGPAQLSVTLLAMEGDAREESPGFVLLGTGAATFSIALPLEATGMQVSSVTLHTGNDPSAVLGGGPAGQLLPPGYTLAVRDQRSGEWTELGDLAEKSSFEVDPAVVLDPAGRIEARISGDASQQFGQMPVFVTARIEGVLEP